MKKKLKNLDNLGSLSLEDKDDKIILNLAKEASTYLLRHKWCKNIVNSWLGISWGEILCVFLFQIDSDYKEVDEYVWIIVGDIPPAYIDIESASNPEEALLCYTEIMDDWVNAIENNESVEDCYPVEVEPSIEHAMMLKSRLNLIKKEINIEK